MSRLLLVDDQADVRTGYGRALRRFGHDVVEAPDGRAALDALGREPFDLLLTDINMPDMDGIELILAVTERWPGLPVIAISGGGLLPKELLLGDAQLLGVIRTLEKPVGVDALESSVEEALRSAEPS